MEKFPDHLDSGPPSRDRDRSATPSRQTGFVNGGGGGGHSVASDRWRPAGRDAAAWPSSGSPARHGRQKSLSDAFRTIRNRSGSVGQNAHEIADALKAPVSPMLVALCLLWYTSSALTNTSSKSILNAFDRPATLTLIQFAFVSSYCFLCAWLASIFPGLRRTIPALKFPIRPLSRHVIATTLPLAIFQIGGHLFSSMATSKIPVSLVHTIKGLSPLFTVLAYRLVFDIRYPSAIYVSLVPLTIGVMLACSGKHAFGGELLGVIYALVAAVIFVTQNIFSKKLFNEAPEAKLDGPASHSDKLDKLNLLCYSSGLAFLVTLPIWLWSDGGSLIQDLWSDGSIDLSSKPDSFDHGRLALEFFFNGTFHFVQNILAFVLLSLVSPVTYSVASLIKRVFVILMAIVWFQNTTTKTQAVGIGLTFLGLYLYDRANERNKADRKAQLMTEPGRITPLLPLDERARGQPALSGSPLRGTPLGNGRAENYFAAQGDDKKADSVGRGNGSATWLPPGTRQEDTWQAGDQRVGL